MEKTRTLPGGKIERIKTTTVRASFLEDNKEVVFYAEDIMKVLRDLNAKLHVNIDEQVGQLQDLVNRVKEECYANKS